MRAFVAIEIQDESILDAIAKIQSEFKISATPVSKKNMHFTLLFLGEITEDTASSVKKALGTISFKKIDVNFTHVGAFPNPRSPRVIWIGVDDTSSKQLVDLASQVEKKLGPLGFRPDKPFKPHLTIFRIKNKVEDIAGIMEKFKKVDLGKYNMTELKFKQSILTPSGPIYSDLQVILAQ
ncbi:MAG: RNA 2',3'-cyclic phosphodiesterase [Thaumarchaeota archaeon]|nr:RNA 2',3'-cyclic phosphodiesterase [Nitrososphaerota archaeon]MDE1831218.1 RNA 2',3'-cyclic phosphodiesterase [Nitrososphaerota archaeon]MDE1840994.1 RNA 2',3'-cyclic phosphodiesterase [Nitrososphaerota archaeon]MDE1877622.1 RNA 2',3'-cyclic phosphodiesterase [Nitrososphaerota archaeon]